MKPARKENGRTDTQPPGHAWPEWDLFSRERLFYVRTGVRLPLQHCHFLSGETQFGSAAVRYLPVAEGVLTSRPGILALHDHDLSQELWRIEDPHGSEKIIYEGGTALVGVEGFCRVDVRSGAIVSRAKRPVNSTLVGFTDRTLLLYTAGVQEITAIDRESLAPIWRQTALGQHASFGERYLIQDKLATVLRCLGAATGEVLWLVDLSDRRFWAGATAPPQRLSIVQGYPSAVAVGDRVLVVLNDARLCVLSAGSGEVLDIVRPGVEAPRGFMRPMHLITERSIFYLHAVGMVEFDHRTMKEVSRIDFRKEVEPHYAKHQGGPYPCAFWVSEESVIWTNMSGLLIGVSRKAGKGGARKVWTDWLAHGALVPVAQFPLAFGEYFYFSEYGDKKVGLHAYRAT